MYRQKQYQPNLFQTIFSVDKKPLNFTVLLPTNGFMQVGQKCKGCAVVILLNCGAGAENMSLEIPPA